MSDNFDRFAILNSFLDEVASYLPEIEAHLDRLQRQAGDRAAAEETYRRVHTIAGSAAMMGFAGLAEVARGMEEILGAALDDAPPLDPPTVGMLRRSSGRLARLLAHARAGTDDRRIVDEDAVDRSAWRGAGGIAGRPTSPDGPASRPGDPVTAPPAWPTPAPAASGPLAVGARPPAGSSGPPPSFEEMVQAFRSAPSAPMPSAPRGDPGRQPTGPVAAIPRTGSPADPVTLPPAAARASGPIAGAAGEQAAQAVVAVSPAWEDLRGTEGDVRRQVAALREVVQMLREAGQAMEEERTELRGFLDGSKDALDRLEDWAGQAMGLDLRHSPEHVRRFLPLSVVWVVTTRLKKLVTLLSNSGRHLTATKEDIDEALGELHAAVVNVSQLFSAVAAAASATGAIGPDGGFSATVSQVAQFTWSPPAAAPAAAPPPAAPVIEPAPVEPVAEPGVAEAAPPAQLPPGARAELARGVREELRRELEDEVRAELAAELRRDEADRLRQEIEIQVRRQVLADLRPGAAGSSTPRGADAADAPAATAQGTSIPRPPSPAARRVTEQSAEAADIFREEADGHLQAITEALRVLEARPDDRETLLSLRRSMHTLKGASGMMGYTALQQLAHASEDLLERLVDGRSALTPDVLGLLLDTASALERVIAAPGEGTDSIAALHQRYASLLGTSMAAVAMADTARRPTVPRAGGSSPELAATERDAAGSAAEDGDISVRLRLGKLDELINLFGDLLQNRTILEERLRRLGGMIVESTLASRRLRDIGTQIETRFEAATLPSGRPGAARAPQSGDRGAGTPVRGGLQSPSGTGWAAANGAAPRDEFDELELDRYTEFHRLSRGLAESVSDLATLGTEMETLVREIETLFARETRLSSAFQDRLLKTRLVPLEPLVPRLYRTLRASALRRGREAEFLVQGLETEVDRTVYEEIADPLLHLVRNAVVHGIEPPDARVRAGKSREGHVTLSATEEGNQVIIVVRDDGAGVDPARVRAAAIARGLVDPRAHVTPAEALNLIFKPGLSTADVLDEESGRGVGLDVVADAVARMRGTVEVESQPGEWTTFTLRIPVSLQIARAVLARVGQQVFAIPMTAVEQIGRLDYYERAPRGDMPAVIVRGTVYRLVPLASYLGLQPGPIDDRSPVLLFSSGRQHLAVILEAITGRQEVVVKGLGPHLRDVPGVGGATILGDGRVVLILNLPELLARSLPAEAIPAIPAPTGAAPRMPTAAPVLGTGPHPAARDRAEAVQLPFPAASSAPSTPAEARAPARYSPASRAPGPRSSYVLVVDDSPSVRRVVGGMLRASGWSVQVARDGIEALETIGRQTPAAVLLDIEMPRMDGYELMAAVRSQPQFRSLPLIVLTSRAATKHQQRALQLGADAYIVKPYQDEELLQTIDDLVARNGG